MTETLDVILLRVAALLPQQGPITAFAFLNPLEGLEGEQFVDVLRKVPELFGCEPLLPEGDFRAKLKSERITLDDLKAVLDDEHRDDDSQMVAGLISCAELRLSMLLHPLDPGSSRELR